MPSPAPSQSRESLPTCLSPPGLPTFPHSPILPPHPWGAPTVSPDLTLHHCPPALAISVSLALLTLCLSTPLPRPGSPSSFPLASIPLQERIAHCRPAGWSEHQEPGFGSKNHHSGTVRPESASGANVGLPRGGVHCLLHSLIPQTFISAYYKQGTSKPSGEPIGHWDGGGWGQDDFGSLVSARETTGAA